MIRKLLSPKWYVPFLYGGIDYEKWPEEKQKSYFVTDYDLPPMKENDNTAILIQQLTARQLRELPEADSKLRPNNQDADITAWDESWVEYVLRYGVKEWRSFYFQDEEGKMIEVLPTYEETPSGRRLSTEAYEHLCFFCPVLLRGPTATEIVYFSRI